MRRARLLTRKTNWLRKNIERTQRQAREQSGVPGIKPTHSVYGLRLECAVFQFRLARHPGVMRRCQSVSLVDDYENEQERWRASLVREHLCRLLRTSNAKHRIPTSTGQARTGKCLEPEISRRPGVTAYVALISNGLATRNSGS